MKCRLNISRVARVAGLDRAVVGRFLRGEQVTARTSMLVLQALDAMGFAVIDPNGRDRDDDSRIPIFPSVKRDAVQHMLAQKDD